MREIALGGGANSANFSMSAMAFSGQSREANYESHHHSKTETAAGKNSLKLVGKMLPPRNKLARKACHWRNAPLGPP